MDHVDHFQPWPLSCRSAENPYILSKKLKARRALTLLFSYFCRKQMLTCKKSEWVDTGRLEHQTEREESSKQCLYGALWVLVQGGSSLESRRPAKKQANLSCTSNAQDQTKGLPWAALLHRASEAVCTTDLLDFPGLLLDCLTLFSMEPSCCTCSPHSSLSLIRLSEPYYSAGCECLCVPCWNEIPQCTS